MKQIITLLCCANFAYVAFAYSGGAPVDVCDDMTPKHPYKAKTSTFPYFVTVSTPQVQAGKKMQIKVTGGKEEKNFLGFLVQVRNSDNKAVGSFDIPEDSRLVKNITCHGSERSAATHRNSLIKDEVILDWIAPQIKGKLNVYATVAKDGKTFWVHEKQSEISVV